MRKDVHRRGTGSAAPRHSSQSRCTVRHAQCTPPGARPVAKAVAETCLRLPEDAANQSRCGAGVVDKMNLMSLLICVFLLPTELDCVSRWSTFPEF